VKRLVKAKEVIEGMQVDVAGEKLAGRRKSCRPAKKLPTGEKLADRRKTRWPAKKLPTGKKLADRQKSCRPELPTGEKLAGRRKSCRPAKNSPAGERAAGWASVTNSSLLTLKSLLTVTLELGYLDDHPNELVL
jgi:hypothetical protein